MKTMFMGGAHRGGSAITDSALALLPEPDMYERVVIADPKEDRASNLANVWREHGVRSEGLMATCEKAVRDVDADAIVLAIDTITPMARILEEKPLPTQWQLMAKGLGDRAPVIGMSGTVTDGDTDSRASSVELIKELGSFIKPQSSGVIRENPLNADGLHVMRNVVSRHSVGRLQVLDREPQDISGGTLNLFCGGNAYPMVVQQKPHGNRWKELKQQVLDAELPVYLRNAPSFAVAAVGRNNVDFFVVDSARGRRAVRFHMPLVHLLPAGGQGATNAMGAIGVLGGIASLMMAATVTD